MHLPVLGGANYNEAGDQSLVEQYGFAADVAAYLHRTYGDQAELVARLNTPQDGIRLVDGHPILEAEVIYAARYEMAERVIDVLARRTPLALIDNAAARSAVPRVLEIMAEELGWDQRRCAEETQLAVQRLSEGL
jgi:glycerol-3-phosphate dehydrogenase